jgi:hypothetical protein
MKTLLTFVFIVAATVAIIAAFSFRTVAAGSKHEGGDPQKFTLNIGRTEEDYADVDKDAFDKKLKDLKDHGGQANIKFKDNSGKVTEPYTVIGIQTDKVTTSKVAQNASDADSVANDPNVTRNLSTNNATDLKAVVDTFK